MTASPPFVNRHRELRFLDQQLDKTQRHGTRLALISGLSGMGKTALVQRFIQTAAPGFTCLQRRGWDNQAAAPFQPVREAIRQLLEQRPELRQLPEVQAFGGYLAVLLDPPTESQADPVPIDLLFRALAQLLRSADHPLCIFLDDLQWADEGTFEWLDFALSQLGNTPILWLGAYRREDKEALASLLERGERWTRDDRWAELELGPLGEKEIETLCRQLVPEQEWRDEIPRHVWEKSEGLPLFAVEEVRAYSEAPVSGKSSQDLIARRLKNSLNRTVSF